MCVYNAFVSRVNILLNILLEKKDKIEVGQQKQQQLLIIDPSQMKILEIFFLQKISKTFLKTVHFDF